MRGLWTYRRFIWDTALADLRYRYAGSGLGVFWNVLTPLAMLAVYVVVFGSVFTQPATTGTLAASPFVLYLSAGFLPWGAFVDCLTRGTNALVTNATYLRKMPIPEQVFVAQAAGSAALGMLIAIGLLVVAALALGQPPRWTWLALPVVGVLWQGLGFGFALALGTLNVFFRDVSPIVAVVLQILMWSVPIVYPETLLPAAYRAVLPFNPVYPFLVAFRSAYLDGSLAPAWTWAAMLTWGVLMTGVGYWILAHLRAEVRDVL